MDHPFVGDLSNLSMEQLTEKISSLNKGMSYCMRTSNYDMARQIDMALSSYRTELNRQQRQLLDDGETVTGQINIT